MKERKWVILTVTIMLIGFYFSTSAMATEPIILGLPTPLAILECQHARHAAEMAVEEINATGGVNVGGTKRPFKLIATDTRDGAPGIPVSEALMAYEKLILRQKPKAIVTGFYASEALLASMDITSKHKLPYIATIPMSPKFQKKIVENYEAYKYLFRLSINAVHFFQAYTGVLNAINQEFGFNRAAIIVEEALYTKAIAAMTAKWLTGKGWEVTVNETFPKGTSDYSAPLLKVRNTRARVIVYVCSLPQSVIFVEQWRTMKIPAVLIGAVPPLVGEETWKVHKGKVEGLINLTEAGIFPLKAIPESITFYEKFKKRVGTGPDGSHGVGGAYESVYIFKDAIEEAGSLDPDKMVASIEKTDRKSCLGRIKFGKDHQAAFGKDPKEGAVPVIFQWQKPGTRVAIYPKEVAEGSIQLPEWMSKK
ncbi:MAG: ABC transporter substrate-binding protein [Thermodesulfobacteriota bacterium]|nr:ABC transporter substrate-binding protein [Thermodesulfobacteriota bacterium]